MGCTHKTATCGGSGLRRLFHAAPRTAVIRGGPSACVSCPGHHHLATDLATGMLFVWILMYISPASNTLASSGEVA